MFPEYADLIPQLTTRDRQFAAMLDKHRELDRKLQAIDAGQCDVQSSVLFLDVLSHMERVGNHLLNIAERAGAILEEVR